MLLSIPFPPQIQSVLLPSNWMNGKCIQIKVRRSDDKFDIWTECLGVKLISYSSNRSVATSHEGIDLNRICNYSFQRKTVMLLHLTIPMDFKPSCFWPGWYDFRVIIFLRLKVNWPGQIRNHEFSKFIGHR